MVFIGSIFSAVLVLLERDGVVHHFHYHSAHRLDLNDRSRDHFLGCVGVPFVTLSVLYDACFASVDDFCFGYGLFQHFVGVVLDVFGVRLLDLSFSFVNDELIGAQVVGEFRLDESSAFGHEGFDFINEWVEDSVELMVDVAYGGFLSEFFFDEYLLEFVDFVVGVYVSQVGQFVYELRWVDV